MIDLVYELVKFEAYDDFRVSFIVNIMDGPTLAFMEKAYPGKLTYDGGRVFTLTVNTEIQGMQETNPLLWAQLKEHKPEIIRKFVLARLKGEADGLG